MLDLISDGP